MKTMNVSINDDLHAFAREDMKNSGFDNASEYFRTLIRERRQSQMERSVRLFELASTGQSAGEPPQSFNDRATEIKREVRAEKAKKGKGR